MTRSIHISSHAKRLFALLFVVLSSISQAASLGRINVQSALGEAFRADVELLNISGDESSNLVAKTASADTFRRNGVDFNPAVLAIKAALVTEGSRSFIALRSNDGIQEPLLEILLEVSSDKGTFVKKYTVLLDPPLSKTGASETISAQSFSNATPAYNHSTLSLKPSFNLNQSIIANTKTAKQSPNAKPSKKMSTRELRALKKAQRKQSQFVAKNNLKNDKLSVVSPADGNTAGQETPQSLARRLVKAGIKDAAQIEALINALNAVKDGAAQAKVVVPPPSIVSVINLPPFAEVPQVAASVPASPLPTAVTTPAIDTLALKNGTILWTSYFDNLWMLAALIGGLALAVFAWFIYKKRLAAQQQEAYDDYLDMEHTVIVAQKPTPNPTPAAKAIYEGAQSSHTQAFESQFLTEIKIDDSLVQAVAIEPIEHAKNMINQGHTDNATAFLKDLLHDKPEDQSIRLMLITVSIDKKNDELLNEQMEILGHISDSKGEHWLEAKKLFLAYKTKQHTSLEFNKTETFKSNAIESTIDFPTLSLDLSHPTIFAPPHHEVLRSMKPLEFTVSDLDQPKSQDSTKTNPLITLVSPPSTKPKHQTSMSDELLKKMARLEVLIKNNEMASAQDLLKLIAEDSNRDNK